MPECKKKSPRILSVGWGKMEIDTLGTGKDFKLWPGGGRAWDWSETDTSHSPGIGVADVKELVENGARVVILSRGMLSRLKIQKATLTFLEDSGVQTVVATTKEGVKTYNDYVDRDIRVGGLFHSTC